MSNNIEGKVVVITGASSGLGASVTFEPGARTAWHSHPLGQTTNNTRPDEEPNKEDISGNHSD